MSWGAKGWEKPYQHGASAGGAGSGPVPGGDMSAGGPLPAHDGRAEIDANRKITGWATADALRARIQQRALAEQLGKAVGVVGPGVDIARVANKGLFLTLTHVVAFFAGAATVYYFSHARGRGRRREKSSKYAE